MTLLDGISTALWADAGVKAASPGGIASVLLPEKVTLPATTMMIVASLSDPTLESAGLQKVRVQLDCYAADYVGASAARSAIVAFFDGYVGRLADGTELQNASQVQSIDFYDSEARQHRCMVEFYLYFD